MRTSYIQMNIRTILILILLLVVIICKSQSVEKADSIYRELLKSPKDTSLIRDLDGSINSFVFSKPDTALFYASEALRLSELADYTYGIVISTNRQGLSYEMMEDFNQARIKYKHAATLTKQHNFSTMLINIYNNLNILESTLGNYEISLEYLLEALDLAEKKQDSIRLGIITNNIGLRYSELQSQEKALEYYKKAIPIYILTGREHKLDNTYGNMGRSFYILEQYDSAEVYYRRSIDLAFTNSNAFSLNNSYLGLGLVLMNKNQPDSAMKYQKLCYDIAKKNNDEYGIAQALLFAGNIQVSKGLYKKAEINIMEAIRISERLKIKPMQIDAYKAASELYKKTGNYKGALEYGSLYNGLQDTLFRQEKDKAMDIIQDYEDEKFAKEKEILSSEIELEKLKVSRQKIQRNLFIITGSLLLLIAVLLLHRFLYMRRTKNKLAEQNTLIQKEKDRSDELLLNILPHETAQELKSKGSAESRYYDHVTVLFSDFVDFTQMAEDLTPSELVSEIDQYFGQFDMIITKHGIEKIKTIGDAYMCAGGLPVQNETHAMDVVKSAIEIRNYINQKAKERIEKGLPAFQIRIGIHTGPVVAGIVGIKKFAYDIWGDTVNTASRIESSGEPGMINISQTTRDRVHQKFKCIHRGRIEAKGKGEIDMYFVDVEEQK